MSLSLVLAIQAAAAATPASEAPLWEMPGLTASDVPADFDLARYRIADGRCGAADAGDVLVCGPRRRVNDYPLARWARIFGPERPIRAEMDIGGGVQGRIHAEAVPMDRGAVSNRVMIGIGTRF
jgi:hypothetical protein